MGKRSCMFLLAALLLAFLFCGCQSEKDADSATTAPAVEETVPPTVPADGDPDDVTCKGSYTADSVEAGKTVARIGDQTLTVGQLQLWYRMCVAEYAAAGHEEAPDFSRPLDTQTCPVDDSVNSWQQYFLKQALNTWHSAAALELQSREVPLVLEEAYQPNLDNHEKYMANMPITNILYGYNKMYTPNSMHEAYLTNLPETLEALAEQKGFASAAEMAEKALGVSADELLEAARLYNFSYMYFTQLGYSLTDSEEAVEEEQTAPAATEETLPVEEVIPAEDCVVDIRHILLIPKKPEVKIPAWQAKQMEATEPVETEPPVTVAEDGTVSCDEELWAACVVKAEDMLKAWAKDRRCSGATFSELAVKESADAGSALNGGIYRNIRKGQLMAQLDEWCFDPARQSGDTGIIRSPYGIHVLYFTGKTAVAEAEAAAEQTFRDQSALIEEARKSYPADIDYSAIALTEGEMTVSASDLLYPDIAHERFPEIPVYLQQDYPSTQYGYFPIRTHGCGITTMAMLATYMTDDELTPPEMCARYGNYSHANGTDGGIFNYEPAVMGFYLRKKTYEFREAKEALQEGQIVISVQHKGYWTRGGHYIALEAIDDEDWVQVRDSNIFNYGRIVTHIEDRHQWRNIISNGSGYWIYEDKITRIPACSRCGTPEEMVDELLQTEYTCEKCIPALMRRNTYLSAANMDA